MTANNKTFSRLLKEAKSKCEKLEVKNVTVIAERLYDNINLFSCKDSAGKMAVAILFREPSPSLYCDFMVRTVNRNVYISGKKYLIIWQQYKFFNQ